MKPEDKVPSVDLCQELWKLGITKGIETERIWFKHEGGSYYYPNDINWILTTEEATNITTLRSGTKWRVNNVQIIPAPDLSELGELLPNGSDSTILNKEKNHYLASCPENSKHIVPRRTFLADTEANVRAEMLIALKQESLEEKSK